MHKSSGVCAPSGILWGVASPLRNEIRLGGFVPVIFRPRVCTRLVISEFASLVRKSYSEVSCQLVPSYWQRKNPRPECLDSG